MSYAPVKCAGCNLETEQWKEREDFNVDLYLSLDGLRVCDQCVGEFVDQRINTFQKWLELRQDRRP